MKKYYDILNIVGFNKKVLVSKIMKDGIYYLILNKESPPFQLILFHFSTYFVRKRLYNHPNFLCGNPLRPNGAENPGKCLNSNLLPKNLN